MESLQLVNGECELKKHTLSGRTARIYFCLNYGLYTHRQRRSMSSDYGVTVPRI
jgi:hypothetical protein